MKNINKDLRVAMAGKLISVANTTLLMQVEIQVRHSVRVQVRAPVSDQMLRRTLLRIKWGIRMEYAW